MGRIVDLCAEVAAAADDGADGLVLPVEAWDKLRADWSDEDIEDALAFVKDSLMQSELVEACDSLSARLVELLGGWGDAKAWAAAVEGHASVPLDVIGQLARRVDRVEEILEAYRDAQGPRPERVRRAAAPADGPRDRGPDGVRPARRPGRGRRVDRLGLLHSSTNETPRAGADPGRLVPRRDRGRRRPARDRRPRGLHLPVLQPDLPLRPRRHLGPDPGRERRAERPVRAAGFGRTRIRRRHHALRDERPRVRVPRRPRRHHARHAGRELQRPRRPAGAARPGRRQPEPDPGHART